MKGERSRWWRLSGAGNCFAESDASPQHWLQVKFAPASSPARNSVVDQAPAGARREVRVRLRMIVVDKDYVFTVCSKR